MTRNGQAALEYLFTYGWAFLAILITIGTLAYFGIFDVNNLRGEECQFTPGVYCEEFSLTDDGTNGELAIILTNTYGVDLVLHQFDAEAQLVTVPITCELNKTGNVVTGTDEWENEETIRFRCWFDNQDYYPRQAYDFDIDMAFVQLGNTYMYNTSASIRADAQ